MASKGDAEPLPASPKWTRPSDVMKLRQLKRRIKTPGSKTAHIASSFGAGDAVNRDVARLLDDAESPEKENDDEDDGEDDGTPSKRRKKNPFSVSPRRKLNLNGKLASKTAVSSSSSNSSVSSSTCFSTSTKDSLLASFGIGKKTDAKKSVGGGDEALARPLAGDFNTATKLPRHPLQQQQQQQQQQSFLDLISSISDDSVDNTELFQRLSQRQRKATPVIGGPSECGGGSGGNVDPNSSSLSGSQSAPSSANSSLNLSNLNLSSPSSSVGFGNSSSQEAEIAPDKLVVSPFLPVDWSLKTRVRLQSDSSWPWQGTLKTLDEAVGVSTFVRGAQDPSESPFPSPSSSSWHAQIQGATLTWTFPSVPGLTTFPRFGSNLKNVEPHPLTTQQRVVDAMQQDFAAAFTSVFNQLKGGKCPYFYACCQRFTVLFRMEGLSGCEEINVQVAPTSKGLRDGLSNEGIEYLMPLSPKRRSAAATMTTTSMGALGDDATAAPEEAEGEEEDLESSAASNWLESMGIDKSKFPTLNPQRVSLAQDNYKILDGRPESLVKIEGLGNVQAFYNFLLNNDHLTISASGSQAGIPPTILSPSAFKGATLRQLRYTHGTMRYKSTRASQILHTLDVVGPILPHHLLNIAGVARATNVKSFNVSCTNQESTFTFNHRIKAANGASEDPSLQHSNSSSSSSSSSNGSSKLPPEVEALLTKTGLRKQAMAEMGMNRMKGKSGIRESYYEEDNGFTSVLQ